MRSGTKGKISFRSTSFSIIMAKFIFPENLFPRKVLNFYEKVSKAYFSWNWSLIFANTDCKPHRSKNIKNGKLLTKLFWSLRTGFEGVEPGIYRLSVKNVSFYKNSFTLNLVLQQMNRFKWKWKKITIFLRFSSSNLVFRLSIVLRNRLCRNLEIKRRVICRVKGF